MPGTFSFYRIHGLYSLAVILFDFLMIGGLIDAAQWEQFRNIKLCGPNWKYPDTGTPILGF